MYNRKTVDVAKGNWRGILMALGMPESFLQNRHGPCPLCGGKDRFRWDNKDGRGTYICNQCGAGTGIDLVKRFLGLDFASACSKVDAVIGNISPDSCLRPTLSEDVSRKLLRNAYNASRPVEPGDPVDRYLASRNLDELVYPTVLRFAPKIRGGNGGVHPCMLALKRFQRSLNQRGFTAGCFSDSSCSGGSDHAQPAFCRYSSPF